MEMAPTHRCSKCDSSKRIEEFPPSKAQNSSQWCRACLRLDARRRLGLSASAHAVTCLQCGREFQTTYTKAMFCSAQCKWTSSHDARRAANDAAKPDRLCAWCGSAMARTMRSDAKFCSSQCNMEAHRRTRNLRRRLGAAAPQKPRLIPLINLAEFAAAHRHTCGLCGAPVDMTLRHPDPMCSSIDHVLPRANGGADDLSNLQLSHLVCNLRKRNT